jgi:ankyrin repeat protein
MIGADAGRGAQIRVSRPGVAACGRDHVEELIEAIKAGDGERVRGLVAIRPALANARAGEIPVVMLAVYYGHRGVAQTLIDHGADVDVFAAAALNKADRLAMLLNADREMVNAYSADGWTPLALAAYFGARDAARLLIASGADLHARSTNATANTPLHAAVAGKRHELVELLVEAGADVNARDGDGWTPLNLAAHEGVAATVAYLLDHGADPTIPSNDGRVPLATAEAEGKTEAAEVLRRRGFA